MNIVNRIRYSKNLAPYVFLLPFSLMFLVFFIGPILYSFVFSLFRWEGMSPGGFIFLDNYIALFKSATFLKALTNTLSAAGVYVVVLVLLSFVSSLCLDQKIPGRTFFRLAIFLPISLSLVITSIIFKVILTPHGLLNALLGLFGISSIDWLGDYDLALWSVVGVRVWRGVGLYSIYFLAGLQNIPEEVQEAGRMDGASSMQVTYYIIIPMLRPIFGFVIMSSIIWSLRLFIEPWILTGGGPANATMTVVLYLYLETFQNFHMGLGAASSHVITVLVLLFLVFRKRIFNT